MARNVCWGCHELIPAGELVCIGCAHKIIRRLVEDGAACVVCGALIPPASKRTYSVGFAFGYINRHLRTFWTGTRVHRARGAFCWFVLWQLLDLASTTLAVGLGGVELNPLVSRLMHVSWFGGLVGAKLLALSLGYWAAWRGRYIGLGWANRVQGIIVLWNVTIILRLAVR